MSKDAALRQSDTPNSVGPPRKRRWGLLVYALLVVASFVVQTFGPVGQPGAEVHSVRVESRTSGGDVQRADLAYIHWPAGHAGGIAKPPVVLLHGSPGGAANFEELGPLLAAGGYEVYAFDLLGFGYSSPWVKDYSIKANAFAVLAGMDQLGIGRAHVLGWSNGGGTAIHMADMAPDRIASLTLLASVGAQENEGSGNYHFEHFKYGVAYAAVFAGFELVPHFGLLGSREMRHAFVRNFWDSDQRPLRGIMQQLQTPTLILHGRDDVLIAARVAESHHQLMQQSQLVMLDANHFIPFAQAEEATAHLLGFFERHDKPGVPAVRSTQDLSAEPTPQGVMGKAVAEVRRHVRGVPWWAQCLLIATVVAIFPTVGVVLAALLVVSMDIDPGVAMVAVVIGLLTQTVLICVANRLVARPGRSGLRSAPLCGCVLARKLEDVSLTDWERRLAHRPFQEGWATFFFGSRRTGSLLGAVAAPHSMWSLARFLLGRIAAIIAWSVVSVLSAMIGLGLVFDAMYMRFGLLGAAAAILLGFALVRTVPMLLSGRSRRHLRGRLSRIVGHEYWPMAVFYAPLLVYCLWLAFKRGGATLFTVCNPAIANAGGIAGERKHTILADLGAHPEVLPSVLIDAGDRAERVAKVLHAVENDARLGGFPVILKPDAGQRGFSVRIARSEADVIAYLSLVHDPVMVQKLHPGPMECGVLWARDPAHVGLPAASTPRAGRILSITRKEFPVVEGDGRQTLEDLIYAHRRYRRQAHVFLRRFADRASWVPPAGERVRISQSGNHCQGTLFRDGADLITPELEARIDEIARGYGGGVGGLDMGRLDVRFESEQLLRQGKGFAIIELNGTTGESTNLYDPSRSVFWAYGVLFSQWRLIYELGARRRDQGARPLRLMELIRMVRSHFQHRTGSDLAD